MRLKSALYIAFGLAVLGAPAMAQEAKIYRYNAAHNYCPAGLQPISIDGVICCGTPNQGISYQQAMAHPAARTKKVYKRTVSKRRLVCPAGEKGCFYE